MTVQTLENIVQQVFALNKLALLGRFPRIAQELYFVKAICALHATLKIINAKPATLAKVTRHVGLMSVSQTKNARI